MMYVDTVHYPQSNRQWIEPERTGRVILALGGGPDPSLRDRDRLPAVMIIMMIIMVILSMIISAVKRSIGSTTGCTITEKAPSPY